MAEYVRSAARRTDVATDMFRLSEYKQMFSLPN